MATIKSIFGSYADKLQVVVDNNLGLFETPWFPKYFTWAPPQSTLTFKTVVGRSRIEAAATVIARGSRAPLRGRLPLEMYTNKIPPIAEKFQLDEDILRDFLNLQNSPIGDDAKKSQLISLLFDDVKKVGNAAMKRLDMFVLEAISTGQITLTTNNNPDGVVAPTAIDLFMPTGNKVNAGTAWSNPAATPITDITNMVNNAAAAGVSFAKILVSRNTYTNFSKTTEVKNLLSNFLGFKNAGNLIPTIDNINTLLQASLLPPIEIVDVPIGVEKDGKITAIRPFSDTNAVFIPAGNIGVIANAYALEEIRPVDKVTYAKFNNALISKWADNEPYQEFTKVELNAFPSIDGIGSIYLLSTSVAF